VLRGRNPRSTAPLLFYGTNAVGEIDIDDIQHGHAVIRDGKLVYKRRPGESTPVVDKK
jgi:hypothetical protein